ncbi:hypothetical protein F0U44_15520 [Nocardioides humilatus]|uniref:Flagellar FliJ protein n=1 Tax=Nocardioides humilatus TaxID=2607660 RepID=A0A5B1LAE0_9ACTN|nr:hypothetical protein [Nocardioides humilatus]KAA1417703.1 hypothetical protein F0U44_15520 [Nocardioides humilatus]
MSAREDAGLNAVQRVRSVREQDDRIGLRLAIVEAGEKRRRVDDLNEMLATVPVTSWATPEELLAQRLAAQRIGEASLEAARQAATADVVNEEARLRWEAARTRLAAVERLLELRDGRRRTAAERLLAKEADDIAAQRWLRDRTSDSEAKR